MSGAMKFGQTFVLKTAKGKIAAGLAVFLFGAVAVLAAPTDTDRLLCAVLPVVGAALITRGVRQDRQDKQKFREQSEKAAQKPKRKKK